MDQFASAITSTIDKIGRTYFIVGYIPALVFTLIHQMIIFPIWLGEPLNIFVTNNSSAQTMTDLSTILTTSILPLILGLMLLGLNTVLFRMYEGRFWILRNFILYPLYRYNIKKSARLYNEIVELRLVYREILIELQNCDDNERTFSQQKLDGIAIQIEEAFEKAEQKQLSQSLPLRSSRITPTALGNTMAIAEEYPFDRYGIDSVLMWNRLRPLLDEHVPRQAERLTNQKIVVDMTISLSFLFGLLSVEALITMRFAFSQEKDVLLLLFSIGCILWFLFYQASVSAAKTYANIIMTTFDYYRNLILEQLKIAIPESLAQEQTLWLKIAAFYRRGDVFYWGEIQNISRAASLIPPTTKDEGDSQ